MLMLPANNLAVSFGSRRLFASVSLQLHSGQVTVLIGPNGCGKTTLLRALTADVEVSSGSVWVRPGARVAYMPQGAADPRPDVALALCGAALAAGAGDGSPGRDFGRHEGAALAQLARHGISAVEAGRPMDALSAGQRARVSIACALAGVLTYFCSTSPQTTLMPRAATMPCWQRQGSGPTRPGGATRCPYSRLR